MSEKDRVSAHVQIPVEIHEAMKDEEEPMWQVVSDATRMYLGVDTDSLVALHREVEDLNDRIQDCEEEIQSLQTEREELSERRNRLKDQINKIENERRHYDTILDDIIDKLEENPSLNIDSQRSDLEAATELRNKGVVTDEGISEVCSDVRERAAERSVSLEPNRLRRGGTNTQKQIDEELEGRTLKSLQEDEQ